jgi:hypothetical protein
MGAGCFLAGSQVVATGAETTENASDLPAAGHPGPPFLRTNLWADKPHLELLSQQDDSHPSNLPLLGM